MKSETPTPPPSCLHGYPGLDELDKKKKIIYEPVGTQKAPVGVKCIFYTLSEASKGLSIFLLLVAMAV